MAQETDEHRLEPLEVIEAEPEPEEAEVVIDTPTGIVPVGPIKLREVGITGGVSDLPTLAQLAKAHELVKAKISMIHDLRIHAISLTTRYDWTVHKRESDQPEDVSPYLTGAGALKLRDPMRVDMERTMRPEFIVYHRGTPKEYWGAYFHGRARCLMFSPLWHQVSGARFSNEGFFTKGGQIEPCPGDVVKAAATNWAGGAIRKAIGLEQPEWDWLERGGLDTDWIKAKAIGFKDGRHAGARKQERAQKEFHLAVDTLAVSLDKKMEGFEKKKNAIRAAGGQFNLDGSFRWFLEDGPSARTLLSNLDVIGLTEELKPHAAQ